MSVFRPTVSGWLLAARETRESAAQEQSEERQFIERARGGDHDAFAALVQRHQRRVFSIIANLLRRPAEVEDLAQQVFLKAYLALPRFNFQSAFSTWLYRITVNECYDHLRRQKAQKAPAGREQLVGEAQDWDQLAPEAQASGADSVRQLEMRQLAERLLERLPPEDRLLLLLKELEGFSVEEIAELTKMNINTVKVRLFRARKRLIEIRRRFFPSRRS